ncbi:HHL023Wp [Eremothecium sinecaudum]|uniref:HHL023Wp n=1 Tax=Eremothecium sinecaudum TaxID=45286 RepID=A0A0X8HWD8_9SACH|nr:HHL023Wp [Eremothecium sinecaudum]AMD22747.1 HHL023Wp [Eremothecium sinecaudum]
MSSYRPSIQLSGSLPSSRASMNVDWQNPDSTMVEIVNRHLATDTHKSLNLQGGDITREIYRWTNEQAQDGGYGIPITGAERSPRRRSMSFTGSQADKPTQLGLGEMTANEMLAPNGFRRSYVLMRQRQKPNAFTRNFIEFLSLYGHFAGEDLSEEDDDEDGISIMSQVGLDEEEGEETPLLRRRHDNGSVFKTVLLLLKSFVGTGVLFLPKGFHNGGWLFSIILLIICGGVSYLCFMLLINTKMFAGVHGYGDLGRKLHGVALQRMILSSIALSQIGFSSAYIVFTASNLQAVFKAMFGWEYVMSVYIFIQLIIFLPLALTRNIAKLSGTALVADVFILLGLFYLYGYCFYTLGHRGIPSGSMLMFHPGDWTLFVGTAIFTYEGVGLLIPIQESMKHPEKFPKCLGWVLLAVTILFISCGILGYATFGSDIQTVILLNFPEHDVMSNGIQFLYAMAILLSTPLQLFPAIRILENGIFPQSASGKHNPRIKWTKNWFRALIVMFSVLVAWLGADDLDKFVSLVGTVACIPLIYIYPPILHYLAFNKSKTVSSASLYADLGLACLGVILMIYASCQTMLQWSR